jgi:hypothetical protein
MRELGRAPAPRQVLGVLFVFTLLMGAFDGHAIARHTEASGGELVFELLTSFLCFYWYRLDSDIRSYRRSAGLNVSVVMLAIVAIPYYLVRSRAAGQRGRALLRLAGFALLLAAGAVLGAALAILFG